MAVPRREFSVRVASRARLGAGACLRSPWCVGVCIPELSSEAEVDAETSTKPGAETTGLRSEGSIKSQGRDGEAASSEQ